VVSTRRPRAPVPITSPRDSWRGGVHGGHGRSGGGSATGHRAGSGLPPRHPGAARARGPPGARLPRWGTGVRRRVRRRRRLLRHLGLPDHRPAPARDRALGDLPPRHLLRPPGAAAPTGDGGRARRVGGHHGRDDPGHPVVDHRRGHRREHALRHELAPRGAVGRLPRCRRGRESRAALLDARRRGAVLHRLARPHPGPALAPPTDRLVASRAPAGRDRCPRGGVVRLVGAPDGRRPRSGVRRDDHAGVGARDRCAARLRRLATALPQRPGGRSADRRRARCHHGRGRHLRVADPVPRVRGGAPDARHGRRDRGRNGPARAARRSSAHGPVRPVRRRPVVLAVPVALAAARRRT
jgi:hypothetical protein